MLEAESSYSQISTTWGAAKLTDGIANQVGGCWCSGVNPGTQSFVYSFSGGQSATLTAAVLKNYGQQETFGQAAAYYSRNVEIWTSANGTDYTKATNATLAASTNSVTLPLGSVGAKKVKLKILTGYQPDYWEFGEFEVYGTLP